MNIYVLMVTKNEAHRYLRSSLAWASKYADQVFVYDDRSTDSTRVIASEYAWVVTRPKSIPSFIEHEGRFRNHALHSMAELVPLEPGDWVHVVDADEFIFSGLGTVRERMDYAIERALSEGAKSVRLPIPTVWGGDIKANTINRPSVRVDTFWNTLAEPRLWRYEHGAQFLDKPMACRNEPTYVRQAPILFDKNMQLFHMHYGYAMPEDREERYQRYSSLEDHGHNPDFIESIRKPAPTWEWNGPWEPVRRGAA